MKTLMILALGLSLAACGSTRETTGGNNGSNNVAAQDDPSPYSRYDVEWMQRYESAARRGGVRIYWVNLPKDK